MNTEKVIFAFFIILAATLNFGFFLGEFHENNVNLPIINLFVRCRAVQQKH